MKILFTKSEYRTLFDMIYIAEWMLTAFERPTEATLQPYAHLAQKIYSHAKEMGWESLVDELPKDNEYMPSATYEQKSGVQEMIDAYDEEIFWDELADRLAERDVYHTLTEEQRQRLSSEAYDKLATPIVDRYNREFAAHGIQRLKIDTEAPEA